MKIANPDLANIKLKMYKQKKNIFSGPIDKLPQFSKTDTPADHVQFFNAQGAQIMSMGYEDFKKIVEDKNS